MKRIKIIIATLWLVVIALISPIWIGIMYMDITGHGKGYDYNLGSEIDISIMLGIFELVVWLVATIPVTIWLCRKFYAIRKALFVVPLVLFILLFGSGVLFIGWNDFISAFGI